MLNNKAYNQPVGKLTKVDPSELNDNPKPVGNLTKVGTVEVSPLREYGTFDTNNNQLENTLNDIVKTSARDISDSEKDILRDVLSNPNRTPEQAVEAIQVIQGYHPKFSAPKEGSLSSLVGDERRRTYYYLKRDENGVLMPKALSYGERPPQGYDVASTWGNPKQAKGDSWYTDLGKSLFNGVISAVQSVGDLGQIASIAATGEESKGIQSAVNVLGELKFAKDEDLNKSIYNTEGINQWADLLDTDRFNFSKEALWGTLNMAAESVAEFAIGAKGAGNLIKGINGTAKLTKAGVNTSAFTASFLQNLGENIDVAKEAGLEGREIAGFALPVTAGMASFDAKWGLQSSIYRNLFTRSEKQLLKDFAKQAVKTSAGELSEAGLKELIKGTTLAYDRKLATMGKDILASMTREGLQETGQDAVQKAGEELFDKLGGEDKFGTDATDPKSFGSYMQSLLTGFVSGGPLSLAYNQQRLSNEKQSIDAFKVVEGGQDKINEFKANVYAAQRSGELTEQQRDQALFKIDAYNKYWNQTKDLNMSKEDKRKAFKLSFSIEGLKQEIPPDVEKLDPIEIAKVKNKEELIKGLQKELNGLLLRQEIIKEPVVGQDTINKVDKATKPKEGEEEKKATHEDLLKRFNALVAEETDELDLTEKSEKRKAVPKFTDVDEKGNYKFAQLSDPLQQKQSLHDYFKENPQLNNQMDAFIVQGQNNVWKLDLGNGRYIQFARSIEPEQYVGSTDKFPSGTESFTDNDGREYTRYTTPVGMRLETIKSKSTPQGYKRVLNIYNKETGEHIAFAKETKKGTSKYSQNKDELDQLNEIKSRDNRSPYQRPPERESVSKEEIKAFADKMQQGTLDQTPENSQFYENNKKAVEAELKERASIGNINKPNTTKPEVIDYDEISINRYSPSQQLKFNQGIGYEPVRIVGEEDLIRLVDIGSKMRKNKLPLHGNNEAKRLEKKYNTHPIDAYDLAREAAKNSRSKTMEKIVVFTLPSKKKTFAKMTPVDQETEQRYFEQNRPLSDTEVQEQLEAEQARDRQFAQEGVFSIANSSQIGGYYDKNFIYGLNELIGAPNENVLNYIKNYTNDDIKEAIDVMARNTSKINNIVKFAGFTDKVRNNDTFLGIYEPKTGDIYLNSNIFTDFSSENLARVIAHEYIHAFTHSALHNKTKAQTEKEFTDNMNSLFGYFKQTSVFDKEYGFTNVDEFVAEITTNPEFVKKLIESKNRNIIQRFIDALLRLFGIERNPDRANNIKQAIEDVLTFIPESTPRLTNEDGYYASMSDVNRNAEKLYNKIKNEPDLSKYSYEDLVDAYNYIITSDLPKGKVLNNLMVRIAMNIFDRQVKKLESDPEFSVEKARTMDATAKDIKFKVLSHFTDSSPELQALSDMWDKAYFNKVKESREEKRTNEKLATKVIKDFNSKLPIEKRITNFIQSLYSNINYKYFDFLDDGTGKVITMDQAKKKGLSAPQMNYLEFVREKLSEREKLIGDEDIYNIDMEVLRLDKKFWEATRTENLSQAFSNWLATTPRLNDVKIGFTDPETKATSVMSFKDVESRLVNYGNKGLKQKIKSLGLLLKYNFSARKKLKEGPNKLRGEYLLDENGKLQSKFNKVTDSSKSYSKDFYNAMNEFIEDNNHIKHISPLMPVINSIEYLNTKGAYSNTGEELHAAKPNVVKWINEWRDLHILRKEKETIPELDMSLKFLRFLTSATSMWFAVPANILNDVIGVYNNWRQFGGKAVAKGNLRLFTGGDRKFKKEYGYGLINRYAVDILRKYGAVSTDVDSNPGRTVKNVVLEMAYLLQKYGEFHIQGSGLLGLMDKKDFDSFEYRKNPDTGIEELVVKQGVNEAELEARILKLINEVSDVQGKYSDKDKRNIMNNELGKAVMQFKTWMPDWWRIRFSDKGSYVNSVKWVMDGMRKDMREKGVVKAFWDNKDFMRTIRGIMGVGFMMSIAYQDDDDKKKSEASKLFQRALSDVLFVFDPDNLKFTLTRPIAAIGTIEKLINATDHLFALEADDYYKRTGDPKILNDLLTLTPGRKIADTIDMLDGEDE